MFLDFKAVTNKLNTGFIRNTITTLLGRFASAGGYFIVTLILMKYLSVKEYGEFSILFSYFSFVPILVNLGIDNSFVALGSPLYSQKVAEYTKLKSSFITLKLFLFLAFNLLFLIIKFVTDIEFPFAIYILGTFVGLFITITTIFQAEQKFSLLAKLMPLRNIIALIFLGGHLLFLNSLSFYSASYYVFISPALAFIIILIIFRKQLIYTINGIHKTEAKNLIKVSKWIMLFSICNILYTRIDFFMLDYFVQQEAIDIDSVGYFSAAVGISAFLPTLTSTISVVLLPKISEIVDKDKLDSLKKRILKFIPWSLLIGIVGLIISKYLLSLLFGEKYEKSIDYLYFLVTGMIITFFKNTLTMFFYPLKKPFYIFLVVLIMLIVNILSDYILIPLIGTIGVAYAYLLVCIVGLLITIFLLNKISSK